jgi:hypothetical protein
MVQQARRAENQASQEIGFLNPDQQATLAQMGDITHSIEFPERMDAYGMVSAIKGTVTQMASVSYRYGKDLTVSKNTLEDPNVAQDEGLVHSYLQLMVSSYLHKDASLRHMGTTLPILAGLAKVQDKDITAYASEVALKVQHGRASLGVGMLAMADAFIIGDGGFSQVYGDQPTIWDQAMIAREHLSYTLPLRKLPRVPNDQDDSALLEVVNAIDAALESAANHDTMSDPSASKLVTGFRVLRRGRAVIKASGMSLLRPLELASVEKAPGLLDATYDSLYAPGIPDLSPLQVKAGVRVLGLVGDSITTVCSDFKHLLTDPRTQCFEAIRHAIPAHDPHAQRQVFNRDVQRYERYFST